MHVTFVRGSDAPDVADCALNSHVTVGQRVRDTDDRARTLVHLVGDDPRPLHDQRAGLHDVTAFEFVDGGQALVAAYQNHARPHCGRSCPEQFLVSIGQRITDDNGSAPEDRIATVFDVIEQILNVRARRQELVTVKFEVPVPPIQSPQPGFLRVRQAGDRESRPLRSEVLTPRRPAFADRDMARRDVAFDPNLMTQTIGNSTGAVLHDPGDIEFGKSGSSHDHHHANRRYGQLCYPTAEEPSTWSSRCRGLSQSSTRRGRSLSLTAIEFRPS